MRDGGDNPDTLPTRVDALARELHASTLEAEARFDSLRRTASQQIEGLADTTAEHINDLIFRVGRIEKQVFRLTAAQRALASAEPDNFTKNDPIYISAFLVKWWRIIRRIRF